MPSIRVDDGMPRCLSCHNNPSVLLARRIAENQATRGIIHLPDEVPLGEADLWWPPSVPWRRPAVDNRTNTASRNKEKEAIITSSDDTEASSTSTIYSSPLDANHFRLIYLTGSEDVSSPIHILLEEYAFDDRPDYETVSYAWGGEDGDSTPCEPVYVGPYWDVILATKNCSALLHHLRPRRGYRVIWLDAICIDQANNVEKSAQISRMRDIYTDCERVVVYFGEDLVEQAPGRLFRARVVFQKPAFPEASMLAEENSGDLVSKCAESAGMSQDQFLARRYLARIWIVQELFLSKKAILPLGSSDIHCEGATAAQLILRAEGEHLRNLWYFQGSRNPFDITESLPRLLKATSHCHASDPRDRVYGLLGLFSPRDALHTLDSNYSISWRDCWVGIVAYMILIDKDLILLTHAVGNNGTLDLPSWVPNIQDAGSWTLEFPTSFQLRQEKGQLYKRASELSFMNESWNTEFMMYSATIDHMRLRKFENAGYRPASSRNPTTRFIHWAPIFFSNLGQASVDSSSGALQGLQAIRVFDRPCRLSIETEDEGRLSIWVRGPSTAAHFRVIGLEQHGLTLDESYQLFVISHQNPDPDIFADWNDRPSGVVLALATASPVAKDSSVVTLHACVVVHEIRFFSMDHLETKSEWIRDADEPLYNLYGLLLSLQQPIPGSQSPIGSGSTIDSSTRDAIFGFFFPSETAKILDFVPILKLLAEMEGREVVSSALVESLSAVAERLCPNLRPRIHDNRFFLTFESEKTFSFWHHSRRRAGMWLRHLRCYELANSQGGVYSEDLMVKLEPYADAFQVLDQGKWTSIALAEPKNSVGNTFAVGSSVH